MEHGDFGNSRLRCPLRRKPTSVREPEFASISDLDGHGPRSLTAPATYTRKLASHFDAPSAGPDSAAIQEMFWSDDDESHGILEVEDLPPRYFGSDIKDQ